MNSYTKAHSLQIIDKFEKKLVPKFSFFEKKDFLKNKFKFIKKIKKKFNTDIIIRSSAINEDSKKKSNAGFYDSYIVRKENFNNIEIKIIKLIEKFKNSKDQILIQEFVKNPEIAGVIFSKDKNTNSHYYDINYDESGKSDLVTSGKFNPTIKSLIVYKESKKIPKLFKQLINVTDNLEKLFNNDRLDIEFCIKKKKLFILQCRPLLGVTKK